MGGAPGVVGDLGLALFASTWTLCLYKNKTPLSQSNIESSIYLCLHLFGLAFPLFYCHCYIKILMPNSEFQAVG